MAVRTPRPLELIVFRFRVWWWQNIGRRIPKVIWHGDEVDVRIVFTEARLRPRIYDSLEAMAEGSLSQLGEGRMAEIEAMLNEIGVTFDRGVGPDGTDWEFDASLRGPVSVKFIGRAKKPGLRQA